MKTTIIFGVIIMMGACTFPGLLHSQTHRITLEDTAYYYIKDGRYFFMDSLDDGEWILYYKTGLFNRYKDKNILMYCNYKNYKKQGNCYSWWIEKWDRRFKGNDIQDYTFFKDGRFNSYGNYKNFIIDLSRITYLRFHSLKKSPHNHSGGSMDECAYGSGSYSIIHKMTYLNILEERYTTYRVQIFNDYKEGKSIWLKLYNGLIIITKDKGGDIAEVVIMKGDREPVEKYGLNTAYQLHLLRRFYLQCKGDFSGG